jgi:hypothetical protein
MIRTLTTDEIDFVAGAGGYCALPSSLTSLSVSKTVTKTTNIASGNTATQTGYSGAVSGKGSSSGDVYQAQFTGNAVDNSAVIVLF